MATATELQLTVPEYASLDVLAQKAPQLKGNFVQTANIGAPLPQAGMKPETPKIDFRTINGPRNINHEVEVAGASLEAAGPQASVGLFAELCSGINNHVIKDVLDRSKQGTSQAPQPGQQPGQQAKVDPNFVPQVEPEPEIQTRWQTPTVSMAFKPAGM